VPKFIPCSGQNFFPSTVEACNRRSYNQQLRNERLACNYQLYRHITYNVAAMFTHFEGDDLLGHYLGQSVAHAQRTR